MLNCSQRILPKSTSHNKDSKRKKDYTIEVPYCSAVQNLVTWPLGFVHPCVQPILYSTAGVKQCAVPLAVSLCWLADLRTASDWRQHKNIVSSVI